MRHSKEEASCSAPQVMDLISAVRELNGLSSQELNILLRDSENFTVQYVTQKESLLKIDMEKLAGSLPLHLIAVLMSSDRDEALLRYLLCGIRFLHSLCDLAPRHAKLEQILLDDVKVSEQLLDMTFYMLIVLACYEQENPNFSTPLVHSTLVACSLHLLTACISSQWQDLVHVLLAHPKVDIFMDAAFGAVCVAIKFLEVELSTQHTDFGNRSSSTAEKMVNHLCQQCEASLQFLQSLCQQKLFRERLLSNKELCGKGGVLFLAQAVLKLKVMAMPHFVDCTRVVAAVSRLKAKVLSILLSLCEAESISYLDEVASSPGSLDLAKSVSLEILELLKTALGRNPKQTAYLNRNYRMGFLQLNAMRLADIFSDDSNFRSYITVYFTKVLTAIFSLPHGDFLSNWCSSELPVKEEDGSIEYDSFAAAGWVLDVFSSTNPRNPPSLDFTAVSNNMSQASYAHQRTSLFVKVIANLHCFVPTICEEQERNLFLKKFMECLQMDQSDELHGFIFDSHSPKAPTVCRNLRSLLSHAESLIPNFLNEEDLQLLRVFFNQLESLLSSTEFEENRVQQIQEKKYEESISWDKFAELNISEHHQEAQSTGGCLSPLRKEPTDLNNKGGNLKEEMCENSAFQDADQTFVNEQEDQGADAIMEDKGKSGRRASGGMAEIDRDTQNVETSGSDTSTTRGKNAVDQMDNSEFAKSSLPIKESGNGSNLEDEKVETVQCEEKQRRKRKRTIMNDKQISLIERALVDEPEMQRNAALVQSWADKLSTHGSEVTSSQLKNWLNNRKARLARTGRDHRATLEGETSFPDKQVGPGLRSHDTPESPGEDANIQPTSSRDPQTMLRSGASRITDSSPSEAVPMGLSELIQTKPGQYVMLVDSVGEEIGKGRVFQVHGQWYGRNLEELKTCVIDVKELKAKRGTRLPYPSVASGVSFEEAVTKIGVMRVMWDANRIFVLRPK